MPLITCPDCSRRLSDLAPTCPHCGRPNVQSPNVQNSELPKNASNLYETEKISTIHYARKVSLILGIGIFLFPYIFSWFTLRNGHTTTSRVLSFSWLALAVIITINNYATIPSTSSTSDSIPSTSTSWAPDSSPTRSTIEGEITAADSARAYNENTISADQQFKGKTFKITGTVASIATDFQGDPYLTLEGGINQFLEPQFHFEKSETNELASLREGDNVALICTGKGDVIKTPMWGSCTLQ